MSDLVLLDRPRVSFFSRDAKKLALVRNGIAKACTNTQFDEFVHVCEQTGLDPILRQIYCLVLGAGTPDSKMVALTGINGYRFIAERSGKYMPSDKEPKVSKRRAKIDIDDKLCKNPLGLVSVTVWVKKMDDSGQWHEFSGTARWDEYVPINRVYDIDPETGADVWNGKGYLDKTSDWYRKGEMMLTKCAEAHALRKGWPGEYSGVWEPAEFDRSKLVDLTPSEWAREGDAIVRTREVLGPVAHIRWYAEDDEETVQLSAFGARVEDFIEKHHGDPQKIVDLRDQNQEAFNLFWLHRRAEALPLRNKINDIRDKLIGRVPLRERMEKQGIVPHGRTFERRRP